MSTVLPPVPYNVPLTDSNGMMTKGWQDFLRKLHQRVGGNVAPTNNDLIDTARLEDLSVTTPKLANGSVTEPKIGTGAVTSAKIGALAVQTAAIDDLSVTTAKIANDAVSFVKLLSTDWTKSTSTNGYQKLPSGIYIQWGSTGSIASGATSSVSHPVAFPTACLQVVCSPRNNSAVAVTATGQGGTGNYSTTGFDLYNRTSVSLAFSWVAYGN